ncbi:peptide deformylase [Sphaerotilus sp.]|uniref:peptide deformylase n=1 Tax=Sphaerotilus sp. TaxID=2093942 RepID=UPI002ACDD77F|nr:peptide deformylase [Sphaerotilus sp.]MDZ7858828.1 peptide deformylase [Sphaerotilus sp.]
MSLLTILRYPDPRLNKVAKPVTTFDDRLRRLVDDMFETMYKARGIGLAATQVDVHERLIVIDASEDKTDQLVLINPVIIAHSAERVVSDEGCLSVPSIYDKVERFEKVTVEALDRHGAPYTFEAEGLLSTCVQHEMDHLMGKVFVEYLSPLKRNRIRSKMIKRSREDEDEA